MKDLCRDVTLGALIVLLLVGFVAGVVLFISDGVAIARPAPEIDRRIIPFDGRKDSVWNMWNGLMIIRQKGGSAPEIEVNMREYHDSVIVKDGEHVLFEWERASP